MLRPRIRSALLLATAFTARASLAQEVLEVTTPDETDEAYALASSLDVVLPGVTVTANREGAIQQAATEVVSILSEKDIARTGEGDIAGALARVPGLSVVGGGFVYVRGLGDRYSQALLNGLPLPSPEPLRRAVPLDLFPTDVIASSLVQKTYSPNFPGEFGGGVINLTTLAVPIMPFLKIGVGISGDTETTGHLGYDHFGSSTDWTGYDNGNRDVPPALRSFFASGERLSSGNVNSGNIAKQFVNVNNGLVQKIGRMPANYSASMSGGYSWPVGDSLLGVIGAAGFSNKWRTRDNIEQTPGSADLSVVDKDYHSVASENRVIANALLGVGYEFSNGSKLRWTNLYIHDNLKRTSLAEGKQNAQQPGTDFLEQSTGWYERELWSTQLTGGAKLETVSINGRASYSQSSREAPFELGLGYVRTNRPASPFGAYFINRLDNGQSGFGQIAFSHLDEDLWSAGADVIWQALPSMSVTLGYDVANTRRDSKRREFQIIAPSTFPSEVALFRPDYLLGSAAIDYYGIGLIETTESAPAFSAQLKTRAAFTQLQAEIVPGLDIGAGVRFERGQQEVSPLQVFRTASTLNALTQLENDYWLPAATLTWRFAEGMQLRANASKTIARPQFRELMFQSFYDPEANRAYRGNPLLVDSEFRNAELRYEWYFAPEQHLSLAAFYKEIDKPIEAFTGFDDNTPITSFANAPKARLYGAEAEVQKYLPLDGLFDTDFFASRRLVLIGNYTYSNSRIKVGSDDTVRVYGTAAQPASNFFLDGSPLTGQSDHLINAQIGLENENRLSQQTLLLSYASDRVTSRGPSGLPDICESPGLMLDFVAREGLKLFGQDLELKLEARNLLGRGYKEFQERGGNFVYFNRYDVGTSYSASINASF
jgi:outer membrane receptor protein involved in Fe transport